MSYDYITIATIPAPLGAVVVIFGALDDTDLPWCHVTPLLGIAIQAQHVTFDQDLVGRRHVNERAVPIFDDVDEMGFGPQSYDDQMMIVTPLTQCRDIWQKVKSSRGVQAKDESEVYDVIVEALRRVGIYPQ